MELWQIQGLTLNGKATGFEGLLGALRYAALKGRSSTARLNSEVFWVPVDS